jgi:hypothetical protein
VISKKESLRIVRRADTLGKGRYLWRLPEGEKSFMSHPPNGRDQGSAPEPELFAFPALQKVVEQKDRRTFAHLARALPWQDHRASDLLQAIDWALALDAIETAKELAQKGRKLFPNDERLRQAAAVLAPPILLGTRPSQPTGLDASQQWLKKHASLYKGQWVAVRSGTFLGSAPTLRELYERLGAEGKTAPTIVVKVLS